MVLNINEFKASKEPTQARASAKKLFELLKENKDKAYSLYDFQSIFKLSYSQVSTAVRTMKTMYDTNLQFKQVRNQGGFRTLFYAHKQSDGDLE